MLCNVIPNVHREDVFILGDVAMLRDIVMLRDVWIALADSNVMLHFEPISLCDITFITYPSLESHVTTCRASCDVQVIPGCILQLPVPLT